MLSICRVIVFSCSIKTFVSSSPPTGRYHRRDHSPWSDAARRPRREKSIGAFDLSNALEKPKRWNYRGIHSDGQDFATPSGRPHPNQVSTCHRYLHQPRRRPHRLVRIKQQAHPALEQGRLVSSRRLGPSRVPYQHRLNLRSAPRCVGLPLSTLFNS